MIGCKKKMVKVTLKNLTKKYGKVIAVDDVSLEIKDGELFTFLGPSGCGKTTTLRLIAGFEMPDKGKILFNDTDVTYKKPYERNTAMVFQNYALWPHMTVYENIAYGLKVRKYPKDEIKRKVKEVLELVKLEGLENRYPNQLSGGQQQRVALARALVVEPDVLLLDEPLSNLDAKLRIEMREEIKRIQKNLKITAIYVTHDQEEAMSMSDRLAVMNKGKVLQVGTPEEIYFYPKNLFVATFIGKSTIIEGKIIDPNQKIAAINENTKIKFLLTNQEDNPKIKENTKIKIVLRPEFFSIEEPKEEHNTITGEIEMMMFVGSHLQLKLKIAEKQEIIAYAPADAKLGVGQKISVFIPVEKTLGFI